MDDKTPIEETPKEPHIQIQRTAISDDVLKRVYNLAQEMCPTPLAYETLKSWTDACPEFCIHFEATLEGTDPAPIGVALMLPVLKEYWEPLLVGEIQESDINPATMFPHEVGADVGLHIFYIERFNTGRCQRNFGTFALTTTRIIAKNKGWNLVGFSALSATAAGRAASRQVGFMPTGYEEMALIDRGGLEGAEVNIIYLYPCGKVGGQEGQGQFHSKSEMMVRYERSALVPMVKSRL